MPANEVKSEFRGQVMVITFNRPENGNAYSHDMAGQFFNIVKPATTDRAIRAIVIQGTGGNFMDGLDLKLYAGDMNTAMEQANLMYQPYHTTIRELYAMEKPLIAVAEGMTAGPGMSFMLACDFVVAARSAKFNSRFTSYAMTPDGGLSHSLARKLGAAKALEILMLSEDFDAQTAMDRYGLVNMIVDDDKAQSEAFAWAEKLVVGPTRAFGGVKKLISKAFEQDLNAQLSLEHSYWGASVKSFDFREAIRAYFAKRPTKFTGT